MFEVPQRPRAGDGWFYGEVIRRRRRWRGPFERPRIPRIMPGDLATVIGPNQVEDEDQSACCLKQRTDANDQIPPLPSASGLVSVDPTRHTKEPRNMHEVEGEMKSQDEEP